MSRITTLVLTCGLDDRDAVARLNVSLCGMGYDVGLTEIADNVKSQRRPGCLIWAGGFNHLFMDHFIPAVERAAWVYPKEFALTVVDEEEGAICYRLNTGSILSDKSLRYALEVAIDRIKLVAYMDYVTEKDTQEMLAAIQKELTS